MVNSVQRVNGAYGGLSIYAMPEMLGEDEVRDIVVRAAEEVGIVPGKPTDPGASKRESWMFSAIVPRQNEVSYTPKLGVNVIETIRLVTDRDPDASKAVTNFLLLMGNGYKASAVKTLASGDTRNDPRGSAYIRDFDSRVGQEYGGGMDALVNVFNLSLVWQGAIAVELELSEDLRTVVDVHPVDPARIVMRRDPDTHRLRRGIMDEKGEFKELPPRQFRYVPFHPGVGNPYGRSPILAALTALFFKIQLLEDLRLVVHNQGNPRLDVTVVLESINRAIPAYLKQKGNEDKLRAWVTARINDVAKAYKALKPDDSLVHGDNITIDYKGPSGGFNFPALSEILDNQIVAGLKQLPVMLGRNEGATTTHATIQWQVTALQIDAMRRVTKRVIEWIHTTALEFEGVAAKGRCEFEPIRASDREAEARAEAQEIANAISKRDAGWITNDDASNDIVGHDAVAEPLPLPSPEPVPGEDDVPERMVRDGKSRRDRADEWRATGGRERAAQRGRGARDDRGQVRHAGSPDGGCRDQHEPEAGTRAVAPHRDQRLRLEFSREGLFVVGESGERVATLADISHKREPDTSYPMTPIAARLYTRADGTPDHEKILDDLIDGVLPEVEDRWRELSESYPGRAVANGEQEPGEWFDTDAGREWLGRFRTMLTDHYQVVFNVRGQVALDELGIDATFRLENPDVIAALEEFGLARVTGMADVTLETLRSILSDGLTDGDHPSVIARNIRAAISGMSGARAETIARTETAEAYGRASIETYRRNGVGKKSWLTANDSKVDAPCGEYQREGVIGIDELFGGAHDYPPAHPRCRCAIVPEIDNWGEPDDPWIGQ